MQCDKLPSKVRAIAVELEQLSKAANTESQHVKSSVEKTPQKAGTQRQGGLLSEEKHKKALEKFKIPVDLANHDKTLFFAKYFLDQDGRPKPSITPFPILLPGLLDKLAMQQAADAVPGLKTCTGGEGDFRVLVIGWDRTAIFKITESLSTAQANLRDEMSPTWQQYLQRHYMLVQALPVSSKPRTFGIKSAQGTYAVECNGKMDSYCGLNPDEYSLRITYSKVDGWIGIFKIGVLYGVMRFDVDRKALLARCKATDKNEARLDEYTEMTIPLEELNTTELEDNASEEEDIFSDLSTDERCEEDEPGSFEDGVWIGRKRRRAFDKAPSAAKRLKSSPNTSTTNRLYFKWRGREEGEGDVAYDGYKNNTGYLQFTDSHCTHFESTMSNDLIGRNVRFQGFKICNEGGAATRNYRQYSERAGTLFDDVVEEDREPELAYDLW